MVSITILFSVATSFAVGYVVFKFVDAAIEKLGEGVSRETGRDAI